METTIKLPSSVQKSIGKYKAMGILIEPLESGVTGTSKYIKVRVKQIRKDTDRILTGKELHTRATEALQELAAEYKIHILPVTWKGPEIENVSASWVHAKMAKHNLKQADLCEKLGVDKHVISKLLSNDFAFTRWHKAAFYYFFLVLEERLNPTIRVKAPSQMLTLTINEPISVDDELQLKKDRLKHVEKVFKQVQKLIKDFNPRLDDKSLLIKHKEAFNVARGELERLKAEIESLDSSGKKLKRKVNLK